MLFLNYKTTDSIDHAGLETLSAVHEIKYAKVTLAFDDFKCYKKVQHILSYHNKHDKSSRSPGPSCTFWAPESTLFAWNSYTAVYSSLCTLCTCIAPDQLINNWRHASLSRGFVDYSENGDHTHRQNTDRIQTDTQGCF